MSALSFESFFFRLAPRLMKQTVQPNAFDMHAEPRRENSNFKEAKRAGLQVSAVGEKQQHTRHPTTTKRKSAYTMSTTTTQFTLRSGARMPAIGLGTWKVPADQTQSTASGRGRVKGMKRTCV